MKEKFKEIYNSNKGWWDSFTSCFVGTLLGIGITFGLSDIIEKKNQQEMQRKITVLSMSNLRNNIDSFKSLEKAYLHTDSVFQEVLRYYPDSVNYIPRELVSQFFTELTTFKITDEFSYSDNVFSSNIEVWESIDNLETIAIINDIISLKGMTYNIVNKLNDLKRKSLDNVSNELTFVNITDIGNSGFEIKSFVKDVRAGNIDSFMKRLTTFFADTPYELARDLELHYQNVMFILFKLLGFYTHAEYHTSEGRIDMVVKTQDYIYVIEFKLDGTAEEAMQQIESKNYALPFECDGRKVVKIGVNFSYENRNVEKWIVKC